MVPLVSVKGILVSSRDVAQLCSDYTALDHARMAVDEHIQRVQTGDVAYDSGMDTDGHVHATQDEQAPGAADEPGTEPEPEFDTLWLKLDDILAQEATLLNDLAEADATTTSELHQKAVILGSLLQGEDARQESFLRALSRSVVRDITRLFP